MLKRSTGRIVSVVMFLVGAGIAVQLAGDDAPAGVLLFLWLFFSLGPAILWRIYIEARSQERITSTADMARQFLQQRNMTVPDPGRCIELVTTHSSMMVIPAVSDGREVLVVCNWFGGRKYLIQKGHVTGYHIDVDGQQIDAVGGSFLGFGMIRSRVEAVSAVHMIINLTDGYYMDICVGVNIVESEFDDTDHFLNRFGALLSAYM